MGQPAFCPTVSSLRALFSTEIFMPRGHDYLWTPKLLLLEGGANLVLALGWVGLGVAFLRRRRGGRGAPTARAWTTLAVAALLLATSHLSDVWLTWAPLYWLDALIRSGAALAVIAAAVLLVTNGDR
jgi:two-component system, NtrC family, sensor kinase